MQRERAGPLRSKVQVQRLLYWLHILSTFLKNNGRDYYTGKEDHNFQSYCRQ